jgi:S-adenosylmethionine:tRNA ribosyltransferase-isomerase
MLASNNTTLDFQLPKPLSQSLPTEMRGIARDEVRLLVSKINTDSVYHASFRQIDRFLRPGDTLVVNTSATIPAALEITLPNGLKGRLHLSNQLDGGRWLAELRQLIEGQPKRFSLAQAGHQIELPDGGLATLVKPYYGATTPQGHLHLWEIDLQLPTSVQEYLSRFGKPIRYDHRDYPIAYYQTVPGTYGIYIF